MTPINIFIVDDHPMMRDALKMSFLSEDDLKIVGESGSALEAFSLIKKLNPDLILMDLLMPNMNGTEAIAKILQENPAAKIIVISSMENEENVLAAIQAGALGYFPKTGQRDQLLEAVRKVADGIPYMPTEITLKLFQGVRKIKSPHTESHAGLTPTKRQQEIISLLVEGKTDEEIAKILHLEKATVRSHIHQIQLRLGLENRSQLLVYFSQNKWA